MKKVILTALAVLVGIVCFGQKKMYCELVGTQKLTGKIVVSVDFGQESFWKDNRLVDESGQVMKFNSMVDAMNYMGTLGWEFEQAYVVSVGVGGPTATNVYHWLLSKTISDDNNDTEGLKTKAMLKEEQKSTDTTTQQAE